MRRLLYVLVLAAGAVTPALGQTASPISHTISAQAIRSVFRSRQAVNYLLYAEKVAQPQWTLQLGVAYADSGNGANATTTPSELRLDLADGVTTFVLDGDLYDRVHANDTTTSGHGDPSLTALRSFDLGKSDSLLAGIGVTVPSGSPVGVTSASQTILAVYSHKFGNDAFAKGSFLENGHVDFWGVAEHDNGGFPPGAKSVVWTGKIYYYQTFPTINNDTDAFVVLARGYRQGGDGLSTLGLGADFQIHGEQFGPFAKALGTLTGTCGISAGHHCGGIEFDLQLLFK